MTAAGRPVGVWRRWRRHALERVFPSTREAREALDRSRAGMPEVDELAADLARLRQRNHFSQALYRTIEGRR